MARLDLGGDVDQHAAIEPVEDLGGVARLHVLVHRDEALKARGKRLVLLLGLDLDTAFGLFQLGELALDALSAP